MVDDHGNPTGNTYPNVRILKQQRTPGNVYTARYILAQDNDQSVGAGGSIRSHYRKRKSSRHVSNKKYSMGRRGSRRRRVRRSRKN